MPKNRIRGIVIFLTIFCFILPNILYLYVQFWTTLILISNSYGKYPT